MIEVIQQVLSGAGDAAMIAVAVGFWKLDKRLSRLEWWRESLRVEKVEMVNDGSQ